MIGIHYDAKQIRPLTAKAGLADLRHRFPLDYTLPEEGEAVVYTRIWGSGESGALGAKFHPKTIRDLLGSMFVGLTIIETSGIFLKGAEASFRVEHLIKSRRVPERNDLSGVLDDILDRAALLGLALGQEKVIVAFEVYRHTDGRRAMTPTFTMYEVQNRDIRNLRKAREKNKASPDPDLRSDIRALLDRIVKDSTKAREEIKRLKALPEEDEMLRKDAEE